MKFEERESLARTRDTSPEAIGFRLVAARKAAGYPSQKDFAALLDLSQTTYNSQEKRGAPAMEVLRYLYRSHGIDFNFVLHGDFVQLAPQIQASLFRALDAERQKRDRKSN